MKISFDDGSFICLEKSAKKDKTASITMCGLKDNGKTLTMSTSELSLEQVSEIIKFFNEIITQKNL